MMRHTKSRISTDTPRRPRPQISLALGDGELATVMAAARNLPYEKRSLFLERLAAQLSIRTVTIEAAIQRVLTGLQHL
jgi:hypothetical protein